MRDSGEKASGRAPIGLVPARGGSKGLNNKNLRLIAGQPLIWHTVRAAVGARSLSHVFVSTDDEEIAAYCRSLDVEVIVHPASLSFDDVPTVGVIEWNARRLSRDADLVVLRATSPLRVADDIDDAVALFQTSPEADSLVSVYHIEGVHPMKLKRITNEGYLVDAYHREGHFPVQRQRLEPLYLRNGAIYILPSSLARQGKLWGDRCLAFAMPQARSININSEYDLRVAELLLTNPTDSIN